MLKILFLLFSCFVSVNAIASKFVIATAIEGGLYARIGGLLCAQLNSDNKNSCDLVYSSGSGDNINLLSKNQINVFFAQEDVLYNAYNGLSDFYSKGKQSGLRKIIPLYPETLNVIVSKDSTIDSVSDLKSKNIRILGSRSGSLFTARIYVDLNQWGTDDYKNVTYSKDYDDSFNDLCGDSLDAVVVVSGNVSPIIQKYVKQCNLKFISVEGMSFVLTKRYPYYFKANIPASLYDSSLENVKSYGVYAFLATTYTLSNEDMKTIIDAYIKILPQLVKDNPNLDINNKSFVNDDFKNNRDGVPYHNFAIGYYKSIGLIK